MISSPSQRNVTASRLRQRTSAAGRLSAHAATAARGSSPAARTSRSPTVGSKRRSPPAGYSVSDGCGPADRVDEQVDRAQRAAEEQPRLAGAHLGEARRHVAHRPVVPGRREIRGHVHAVARRRGRRDRCRRARCRRRRAAARRSAAVAAAAGPSRAIAAMCDAIGGIEGARGLVERRLQRLRIERRRVPGGGGEGGGGRRVAAQRGDAGEPAQGVGHVGGGGQSLPENQRVSLVAAALSRAAAGRPLARYRRCAALAARAARAADASRGPARAG